MKKFKTRNDLVFLGLSKLLQAYIFFLLLLTSARIFFVIYFGDMSVLAEYKEDIAYAFFMGWKYDTMTIAYLLLPIYFGVIVGSFFNSVSLFNFKFFFYRKYLWILSLFVPVILIMDMGFYSYFQDHLNSLFFGLFEDDTVALLKSVWNDYPIQYLLVVIVIYLFFTAKFFGKIFESMNPKKTFLTSGTGKYFLMVSVSLIAFAGAVRGGYNDMVLAPKYSNVSDNEFVNQTALNGFITFKAAYKLRQSHNSVNFSMAKIMGYNNDINRAFGDYLGIDVSLTPKNQLLQMITRRTSENLLLEENPPNVIVFVMESFGSHWIKYNSPQFDFMGVLKNHFDEDIFFNNFISSENGTIGSLLVLGTNIPTRPGARYLSESKYMQLPLRSSSNIPFESRGYESSFYYGGKLAWRDIGRYFKYQGFDNIIGENKIKKNLSLQGDIGTVWGLYDEHLYNDISKKLEESKEPQFMMVLSTSNHPPFKVPSNFSAPELILPAELESKIAREKGLFMERFKAFQYANMKLGQFISKIKSSKLGENTIIAVTGDHNFWGFMNYDRTEVYSKYSVPFYIYLPKQYGEDLKYNNKKLGSHEDIMTTIYNLSLSDAEYISFGEDLLSNVKSYALNASIYAGEEGIVVKDQDYSWSNIPMVLKTKTGYLHQNLRKLYRSTLTISDFFINEESKRSKKVKSN